MAEQITHKRPIRIKIDKDKRKQLQDFYKLREEQSPVSDNINENHESVDQDVASASEDCVEPPTLKISESTLSELVSAHNTLLGKETEVNNTIKNTIYENYYDLIKVNELLKSVGNDSSDRLAQLSDILKLLEK
ncbi:Vps51p [Lachancea thermotolerans]|uniref:KLTH0H09614p n=1 Tax=Lachancea thermotolerans (strain ATCC 56472 / CBS 6340 / NRRL Y-8284) TaxID=559295 RepID=C5E320_LACTC|nr:KLTH0H09614p [Lachancea thermotolerans CBS 6340]CAR30431.1 KLTH0H09614p [Lachancea thermotolerans CBS 6340]